MAIDYLVRKRRREPQVLNLGEALQETNERREKFSGTQAATQGSLKQRDKYAEIISDDKRQMGDAGIIESSKNKGPHRKKLVFANNRADFDLRDSCLREGNEGTRGEPRGVVSCLFGIPWPNLFNAQRKTGRPSTSVAEMKSAIQTGARTVKGEFHLDLKKSGRERAGHLHRQCGRRRLQKRGMANRSFS